MYTREQMLTAMQNPKILEHKPEQTPEVTPFNNGFKPLLDTDKNAIDEVYIDERNRMKFNYARH